MSERMRRVPASILAFSLSLLALIAFLVFAYVARYAFHLNGFVLQFFSNVGLVNTGPSYISELKPVNIFSFDDENAMLWLQVIAFALAALASGFAFWAEWKGEPTTYSSAGFVLATLGIWLLYPLVGLGAQLIGGALLLGIRRASAVQT
jgi:hypothetical protein